MAEDNVSKDVEIPYRKVRGRSGVTVKGIARLSIRVKEGKQPEKGREKAALEIEVWLEIRGKSNFPSTADRVLPRELLPNELYHREELSEEWLTRVARYVARHTKFFELNMWDDMDEMYIEVSFLFDGEDFAASFLASEYL